MWVSTPSRARSVAQATQRANTPFGDVSRTTAVMSWLFKKKKVRTQTLPAWLSVCVWVEGEGSRGCVGQNAWPWPEMCERWPRTPHGIIVCGRGHGPPARAARMALHVRLAGCAALTWGLCVESGDVLLIVLLFPCTHEAGNSRLAWMSSIEQAPSNLLHSANVTIDRAIACARSSSIVLLFPRTKLDHG